MNRQPDPFAKVPPLAMFALVALFCIVPVAIHTGCANRGLKQMLPASPGFNPSHSVYVNPVFSGYLSSRFGFRQLPDSQHISRLQESHRIQFSALHRFGLRPGTMTVSCRTILTTLCDHISSIVPRITYEQMIRAHTQRIIAMMTYKFPVRNWRAVKD